MFTIKLNETKILKQFLNLAPNNNIICVPNITKQKMICNIDNKFIFTLPIMISKIYNNLNVNFILNSNDFKELINDDNNIIVDLNNNIMISKNKTISINKSNNYNYTKQFKNYENYSTVDLKMLKYNKTVNIIHCFNKILVFYDMFNEISPLIHKVESLKFGNPVEFVLNSDLINELFNNKLGDLEFKLYSDNNIGAKLKYKNTNWSFNIII